ncbi:MAG: saccharopine dehydrogenase NADP-binding domain-containing protein, partial [Actinomycetia bacterium]|nr:saccharopine dehydrogenase NADP-binding domain-containing protein [Actinomycetes bacterium]
MKTMGRRAVVLGGYGAVGSEVVHLLADGSRQILVAGRDDPRAWALAATVPGAVPASIEVNRPDSVREVVSTDDLVINCTGVESISLARS